MKKLGFILITLLFVFPGIVCAEDFEYTLFQSRINVNTNRTLDVKELINAYTDEDNVKIKRVLNYNVKQIDNGNQTAAKVKISDIKTNVDSNISSSNDKATITFSKNLESSVVNVYNLDYSYDLGKDTNHKKDFLYYNIASNLDADVTNLIFEIEMPKKIELDNVKLYIDGKKINENDVTLLLDNKNIIGYLNIVFKKGQTLSVGIDLPNNYFKGGSNFSIYISIYSLILPILVFIISMVFFIKYGLGKKLRINDNDNIKDVYDPVEISYLLNGSSMSDDIASIIIYLATKGYLRIVENDDGYKLGSDNTFYLEKLKDYDKNNAVQEIVFNGLFRESDTIYLKDIEYVFYDNYKAAHDTINTKRNYNRLFYNDVEIKKHILQIMLFISTIVMSIHSFFTISGSFILGLIIAIIFAFLTVLSFTDVKERKSKIILSVMVLGLFGLGAYALKNSLSLLYIYLIGMGIVFISLILCGKLTNRTKEGINLLSDVYSFKNHLLNVEVDYINENKNYYFDMVPYAYVLGILSEWLVKGKDIISETPDWYVMSASKEVFKTEEFNHFVRNVIYESGISMTRQALTKYGKVGYKNDSVKTNLNE